MSDPRFDYLCKCKLTSEFDLGCHPDNVCNEIVQEQRFDPLGEIRLIYNDLEYMYKHTYRSLTVISRRLVLIEDTLAKLSETGAELPSKHYSHDFGTTKDCKIRYMVEHEPMHYEKDSEEERICSKCTKTFDTLCIFRKYRTFEESMKNNGAPLFTEEISDLCLDCYCEDLK